MDAADTPLLIRNFAIALFIGALVGIEREQKKARPEGQGTRGIRTFMLIAQVGAVAAWLSQRLETPSIFAAALLAVTACLLLGYYFQAQARPQSIGLTTEISALVVYLLGGLTMYGYPEIAVPLAIASSALLAFKGPIHGLVGQLTAEDMYAALKLLIATFIVLPLLPNETIDRWDAINPYKMWWLVILISGLSLVGYVAVRVWGSMRGTALTGLFGGLVSSTAVTLNFSRRSRSEQETWQTAALSAGLLLSWTVMFVRVLIEVAAVHPPLLPLLLPPLLAMGVAALATATWFYFSSHGSVATGDSTAQDVVLRNPFSLSAAAKFAALFAVVLLAVNMTQQYLPPSSIYVVAALSGLTDVDAITLSLAEAARKGGSPELSSTAIAIAVLGNTLTKCGLAAALGSGPLRRRMLLATGIVLIAAAAMFGGNTLFSAVRVHPSRPAVIMVGSPAFP